jgi:uncharacterized membrane protein YfcA
MAESKRASAADDVHLDVKFDAQDYVRKELLNTRAAIVLAIYGVLLGQLGAIVATLFQNQVASLGVFFLGLTAVKGVLQVTGVAADEWDRKTWAGHIALVFFAWLAAWILLQNAPFVS